MKMLLITAVLVLAACQDHSESVVFPVMPDDLKDCKFYYLENKHGQSIYVGRCPNSTTTTSWEERHGKTIDRYEVVIGS